MKIIELKIDVLKPYDKNPRKNKEAVKYVAESIKEFGFKQPIVIDKNNVIVCGHTRLLAAKQLGLKEVPCILADDLTEEQINAYRLVDNKTNEFAEWDNELLKEELFKLPSLNMKLFGFEEEQKEEQIAEEDNYEEPEQLESIVKKGQVWQLGNHRLMCGDSTDKETVLKLMDGKKADMVFTDPPYGMKKEKDGVLNDNLNYDDLLEFNKQWIPLTFDALKDNGSWYCWGTDEPLMDIYSHILKPMIKQKLIAFRNLITWDKGNGQGQLSSDFRMYPVADEKCLFVMVGGDSVQGFCVNADDYSDNMDKVRVYLETERDKAKLTNAMCKKIVGHSEKSGCHWFDKSQFALPTKEVYEKWQEYCKINKIEAFKKDYDELKKDFYAGRSYFDNTHDNMNNVWHFGRTSQKERELIGGHATPKPIALCSRAIKSSSREGEIVLDVFGGSGSTLIACEQLNRKCYMMELDEHYCDVIINRWESFTGKKAELIE